MQFGVIEAPTIKELFIDKIVSMILSGKLNVSDRLPTERELAEEMKVSKTIVHAGLKDLERMGFVCVNARQGTYIANYAETGNAETLTTIIKFNGGKLDKQTVISLLDLRIAVEGQAVRKFAERHTQEDIAFLRKQLDAIEAVAQVKGMTNRHELAQMIFSWHHAICLRSGNDILPLVLNAFKDVSVFFWETSLQIYGIERSMGHLETILSLLTERKGEDVVRYMSDGTDYYITHM